jgi:hypothetical protein
MTNRANEDDGMEIERRARAAFDASVSDLDAETLSRLNRSRQQALAAAGGSRWSVGRSFWSTWIPAGAVAAAAVLVAVLVLRTPVPSESTAPVVAAEGAPEQTLDPLVVLAAGDDLELAVEADLEFYAWVDLETADGAG